MKRSDYIAMFMLTPTRESGPKRLNEHVITSTKALIKCGACLQGTTTPQPGLSSMAKMEESTWTAVEILCHTFNKYPTDTLTYYLELLDLLLKREGPLSANETQMSFYLLAESYVLPNWIDQLNKRLKTFFDAACYLIVSGVQIHNNVKPNLEWAYKNKHPAETYSARLDKFEFQRRLSCIELFIQWTRLASDPGESIQKFVSENQESGWLLMERSLDK